MNRLAGPARVLALAVLALGLAGCAANGNAASPSPTPAGSPTASRTPAPSPRWAPSPETTWQWQLSGPLDDSVPAQIYDVDLFTTSTAQVQRLHALGRRVICYLDAGSSEPARPDSASYPPVLLGRPLDGWPDEHWLDIRRLDLLAPLIAARLDLCAAKGFDGVEPDNVDGFGNDTGFPLTAADQGRFNARVAELAHQRGLAVGLKNDLDQVGELQPAFDFAVNEQCVQYDECDSLAPFVRAGKAVFHVEYDLPTARFCPITGPLGFSSMKKNLNLDAARWPC